MDQRRRIERNLRIEELEPRIAPVTLSVLRGGLRSFQFTDAGGDQVSVTLSGRAGTVVLLDAGSGDPRNTDIATINFIGAKSTTSLVISITDPLGDNHTPGGRVTAIGQTIGSLIVPGPVTGMTAGAIAGILQLDSLPAGNQVLVSGSIGNVVIRGDLLGEIVAHNGTSGAVQLSEATGPGGAAHAVNQRFVVQGTTPVVISGDLSPGEPDTYQFTARAGERLFFDLDAQDRGSPLDATLSLYFGANLVSMNDNFHGLDPFIDYTFPASGTYRIAVAGAVPQGPAASGSYKLMVSHDRLNVDPREAGDTIAQAQVIATLPAVINGSVADPWDSDFYRFTVNAGQQLTFELDAELIKSNLSGDLILYDAAGNVLATGVTGGNPIAPLDPLIHDFVFGAAGAYVVEVRGVDFHSKGYYTLFISGDQFKYKEAELNDTPDSAQPITPPVVISGAISDNTDVDFFGFNATAGEHLVFQVDTTAVGSTLSADLTLRDAQNHVLAAGVTTPTGPMIDFTFSSAAFYTIEMQGHNSASTGQYLLFIASTVFAQTEGEPNDTFLQANDVPNLPAAISGTISAPTDLDFFKFTVIAGESMFFNVDALSIGSPLVAGISLFSPLDSLIVSVDTGASDPDLTYTFTAPGTYKIEVFGDTAGAGSSGPYKLLIWPQVNEGSSNDTAATSEPPPPGVGAFAPSVFVTGSIEPASDLDFYRFTVAAPGTALTFEVDAQEIGSSLDARLNIYDPPGTTILASNDNNPDPNAQFPMDPFITYTFAAPGNYYVEVLGNGSTTGIYHLLIYPPGANPKNPEFHVNGSSGTATAAGIVPTQPTLVRGSIADTSQSDWYRFDARVGDTITADVDAQSLGSTLAATLTLWFATPFGVLPVSGESSNGEESGLLDPFLTFTVPQTQQVVSSGTSGNVIRTLPGSGTYFYQIQSHALADGGGIGGDYLLHINRTGKEVDVEPVVNVTKPRDLTRSLRGVSGTTVTGSLLSPTDVDRFSFKGVAGQVWAINVNGVAGGTAGSPIMMVVRATNAQGAVLAKSTATNLADNLPFLAFTVPHTGTFDVELSSLNAFSGDYSLVLTRQTLLETDILGGQPLSLRRFPTQVSGNISVPGQMDTYLFNAAAGAVMSFEVRPANGSGLDPALRIVDATGRLIVANDDFGGSTDATLTYRFDSRGTFAVVVGGTAGAHSAAYSLLISRTPSNIGKVQIDGDLGATGLISTPGSLTGPAHIGDDLDGRLEMGLDLTGAVAIDGELGDAAAGALFVGGTIQPTGRIHVEEDIGPQGMIFTRGVRGSAGANAPLTIGTGGQIFGTLVVAQPGTVTGTAKLFPIDDGFTPAPGGLQVVTLYNLDGTGRLVGPFVDAQFYTGDHVIRAERDGYDFTDITPTIGANQGTPLGAFSQAESYWQIDRYHSYMALLGFGNTAKRSTRIFVDHPATDPGLENNAFFDPDNQWLRTGTNTDGDPVRLGESGSVVLHEYNHAVTDDLLRVETNYISTPFDQTGAIGEGLSDYRPTSFFNDPRFSWDDPPPGVSLKDRITDNFHRYDSSNVNPEVHTQGSTLSGALWDLRQLLGPTVVDTLSMAALPGLGHVVSATHPDPTLPELLALILSADTRVFGGVHRTAIQEAFAIHRIGSFDFMAGVAGLPVYIVNPSTDTNPFSSTTITRTFITAGVGNWRVEFDSLVTKIGDGDQLIVNGNVYTPTWNQPPAAADFGRGRQGPANAVTVIGTNTITLQLVIGPHAATEGDPQVSFGFLVDSITQV